MYQCLCKLNKLDEDRSFVTYERFVLILASYAGNIQFRKYHKIFHIISKLKITIGNTVITTYLRVEKSFISQNLLDFLIMLANVFFSLSI